MNEICFHTHGPHSRKVQQPLGTMPGCHCLPQTAGEGTASSAVPALRGAQLHSLKKMSVKPWAGRLSSLSLQLDHCEWPECSEQHLWSTASKEQSSSLKNRLVYPGNLIFWWNRWHHLPSPCFKPSFPGLWSWHMGNWATSELLTPCKVHAFLRAPHPSTNELPLGQLGRVTRIRVLARYQAEFLRAAASKLPEIPMHSSEDWNSNTSCLCRHPTTLTTVICEKHKREILPLEWMCFIFAKNCSKHSIYVAGRRIWTAAIS